MKNPKPMALRVGALLVSLFVATIVSANSIIARVQAIDVRTDHKANTNQIPSKNRRKTMSYHDSGKGEDSSGKGGYSMGKGDKEKGGKGKGGGGEGKGKGYVESKGKGGGVDGKGKGGGRDYSHSPSTPAPSASPYAEYTGAPIPKSSVAPIGKGEETKGKGDHPKGKGGESMGKGGGSMEKIGSKWTGKGKGSGEKEKGDAKSKGKGGGVDGKGKGDGKGGGVDGKGKGGGDYSKRPMTAAPSVNPYSEYTFAPMAPLGTAAPTKAIPANSGSPSTLPSKVPAGGGSSAPNSAGTPAPTPVSTSSSPSKTPVGGTEAPTGGTEAPTNPPTVMGTGGGNVSPSPTKGGSVAPSTQRGGSAIPSRSPFIGSSSPTSPAAGGSQAPATVSTNAPTMAANSSAPSMVTGGSGTPSLSPSRNSGVSETPSLAPVTAPNGPVSARVADYYLAYNDPTLTADLTADQYEMLLQQTTDYFNGVFTDTWADSASVQYEFCNFTINESLFGAGIPAARFILYINFNTSLTFAEGSVVPGPSELFAIMASAASNATYITDYVWKVTGLGGVMEVVFRAIEMAAPAAAPTGRSADVSASATQSSRSMPVTIIALGSAAGVLLVAFGLLMCRRQQSSKQDPLTKVVDDVLPDQPTPTEAQDSSTLEDESGNLETVNLQ